MVEQPRYRSSQEHVTTGDVYIFLLRKVQAHPPMSTGYRRELHSLREEHGSEFLRRVQNYVSVRKEGCVAQLASLREKRMKLLHEQQSSSIYQLVKVVREYVAHCLKGIDRLVLPSDRKERRLASKIDDMSKLLKRHSAIEYAIGTYLGEQHIE